MTEKERDKCADSSGGFVKCPVVMGPEGSGRFLFQLLDGKEQMDERTARWIEGLPVSERASKQKNFEFIYCCELSVEL